MMMRSRVARRSGQSTALVAVGDASPMGNRAAKDASSTRRYLAVTLERREILASSKYPIRQQRPGRIHSNSMKMKAHATRYSTVTKAAPESAFGDIVARARNKRGGPLL